MLKYFFSLLLFIKYVQMRAGVAAAVLLFIVAVFVLEIGKTNCQAFVLMSAGNVLFA